jgi:hypothetical protein
MTSDLTPVRDLRRVHGKALLILWLMVGLYVANFGILSILQNAAFETGAADLGNMNQAAWYTLHCLQCHMPCTSRRICFCSFRPLL